jgi:WhiB family redox-sensing transcriptional regulator
MNSGVTIVFNTTSHNQARHWRDRAVCRGLDTELFFPGQGEPVEEAKAICANCAVQAACANYAVSSGQRFGIWGGQTERDRRRLRARRRAATGVDEETAA